MGEPTADPLTINVRLLVRELFDGRTLRLPIADLELSSLGDDDVTREEQQMFLEAYLAKADAETLARFSMPVAEIFEVQTVVERDDLPRTLQIDAPIEFNTVLLPRENGDAWVIVPELRHTFYVSRREDRQEVVAAEIRRIASVKLTSPDAYRNLLPAKSNRIESMAVAVERDERLPAGRAASIKRRLIAKTKQREAKKVLESVAIALHERPVAHDGPPIVGRNRFLTGLTPLLAGKVRLNILLLGDELVGKSAIVHEWLRRAHAAGERPLVYGTSGAQLIAGMSGLGQWQERVRRVMEAAAELDAVLYFDDLRDLFSERATSSVDIPGAMKPYLEDGRVRVLAELPSSALSTLESRATGFFSCFTRMRLEALDSRTSKNALTARVEYHARKSPDRPNLDSLAIDTVIDLADRYLVYQPHPGKVMRMFDELRAVYERDVDARGQPHPITPNRVLDAFSRQTGIPGFLLREDRGLIREEVVRTFEKRIIGQRDAIARVVDAICVVKAGLQPSGKPLATFLFIGPTGVGKTELARTLADFLFSTPDRMVRFDMSEYSDATAAERLIRGTDRAEGLLTRKIRQEPFCVLLLDEIEKAHPAVLDLLLQVCGEGRLTDARGKTAYFHNAIIIMTSNLGAAHRRTAIGIDAPPQSTASHYRREVENTFRPEFVNRLDRIIAFDPLTADQVQAVARVALERIAKRRGFSELGVAVTVTDDALVSLANAGFSETYGARAIRRLLEDELVAPIAHLLARAGLEARNAKLLVRLSSEEAPSDTSIGKRKALLTTSRGALTFQLYGGRAASARTDAIDTDRIAGLRRRAKRYMALDVVEEAKEHLQGLRSELSQQHKNDSDARTAKERGELMREHHRYTEAWNAVARCADDLVVAEELAIGALYSGADPDDARQEAERVFAELESKLVYLLLAREHKRDAATLTLTELDRHRGLEYWLVPALRSFKDRGWSAEIHLANEQPNPNFGPWSQPRDPADLLGRILAEGRKPLTLLLKINGPYAGVLLALEAGRHVYTHIPNGPANVEIAIGLVAMQTAFEDKHYAHESMAPPVANHALKTGTPVVREHDHAHSRMRIFRQEASKPFVFEDYWARLEQTTLEHLLVFDLAENLDRDQLFIGPFDRIFGSGVEP